MCLLMPPSWLEVPRFMCMFFKRLHFERYTLQYLEKKWLMCGTYHQEMHRGDGDGACQAWAEWWADEGSSSYSVCFLMYV